MILKDYIRENRTHYKHYLLLLLICLLAYWPLTFGIFSVKNDAIHYFLPYRFHISEALRNGEFPFWSPYIYMGYPVQGDMQSGAWNPVVWFFSLFGRYDLTLFHFENLLYIFLAGAGMYKLTVGLTGHARTALLTGVAWMLSGFMLSGQLINWLAAAAFIPFVIHYYLLLLRRGKITDGIKTGISLYLLFTAGYPSFFILTGYILLALFLVSVQDKYRNRKTKPVRNGHFLLAHLIMLLAFAGLALPAIISYIDLLPYYQRGSGAGYEDVVINSFDAKHLVTLLYPATIRANDIASITDITCRNIYTGIIPLLLFIALPPKWNRRNVLLSLLGLFALLFSLGDATPLRKWCYDFVPLMNTFRHPSQARLFFMLALLLLAAPGLQKLLSGMWSDADRKRVKTVFILTAIISLVVFIVSLTQASLLRNTGSGGITNRIKAMLDTVSFNDTIALNSLLQLAFLAVIIVWFKKWGRSFTFFTLIWVTNLFIMAQLVLPASFVSKMPPSQMNRIIHVAPHGFPADNLTSPIGINEPLTDTVPAAGVSMYPFYSKKITASKITNSPAYLSRVDSFVQTKQLYDYVAKMPAVYAADLVVMMSDTSGAPPHDLSGPCRYGFGDQYIWLVSKDVACGESETSFTHLSSNSFDIRANLTHQSMVVLTQAFHHSWKAYVDDKATGIQRVNLAFMGVIVPEGKHTLTFRFVPVNTIRGLWIQLATVIILFFSALFLLLKRKNAQ